MIRNVCRSLHEPFQIQFFPVLQLTGEFCHSAGNATLQVLVKLFPGDWFTITVYHVSPCRIRKIARSFPITLLCLEMGHTGMGFVGDRYSRMSCRSTCVRYAMVARTVLTVMSGSQCCCCCPLQDHYFKTPPQLPGITASMLCSWARIWPTGKTITFKSTLLTIDPCYTDGQVISQPLKRTITTI